MARRSANQTSASDGRSEFRTVIRSNRRTGVLLAASGLMLGLTVVVATPAPATAAKISGSVAHTSSKVLTAYVSDPTTDSVTPIQIPTADTYRVGTGIGVGSPTHPEGVALSPDGTTLYVAQTTDYGPNVGRTIAVVDTATDKVTGSIDLGAPLRPYSLAITPDGSTLVAGNANADSIDVIGLGSRPPTVTTVSLSSVAPNSSPMYIAMAPDGSTVYAYANNSLVPISLVTDTPGTPIPLGTVQDGPSSCGVSVSSYNGAQGRVEVSPDGSTVAVGCGNADVDLVDVATQTVTSLQMNQSAIGQVDDTAFTPDGQSALVAGFDTDEIYVVHLGASPSLDQTNIPVSSPDFIVLGEVPVPAPSPSPAPSPGCVSLPPGTVVGLAATNNGGGYWIASSAGLVDACGDAGISDGELSSAPANPIVGMAATPDGGGYWLVAAARSPRAAANMPR
ncbi:MAG: hypothetical protein ACYCV7_08775 [Acidimicrobiales bacterium]